MENKHHTATCDSLHHASSVSFENKIYDIGGYMGDSTPSDRLYVYDPIRNSWTQAYPMPTPRGSPNANIVNGKQYVIGGDLNDHSVSVVESHYPNTNRWTTQSPIPTSRHHAASAIVGGNVSAIGGRLDSSFEGTDIVEKYDPISDE
jgi:Kelch motif protein